MTGFLLLVTVVENVRARCGGNALVSINEVNLRRLRLVSGWVTVFGFNTRCRRFIAVCNQPPWSTHPGHPFVGRRNEYQPKGGVVFAVECWTCDDQAVAVRVSAGHHGVNTLGKFLTPMCLCRQAVQLGTGQRAVALRPGSRQTVVCVWVAG